MDSYILTKLKYSYFIDGDGNTTDQGDALFDFKWTKVKYLVIDKFTRIATIQDYLYYF